MPISERLCRLQVVDSRAVLQQLLYTSLCLSSFHFLVVYCVPLLLGNVLVRSDYLRQAADLVASLSSGLNLFGLSPDPVWSQTRSPFLSGKGGRYCEQRGDSVQSGHIGGG